jgi:signal transduction histidine kinase
MAPLQDNTGPTFGAMAIIADLTEQKRLEDRLYQAQKLESNGQLAAGIAHEINTPIQYIGDNTRFLMEAFADQQKLLGVYQSLAAAARAGSIPARLLEEADDLARRTDLGFLGAEVPQAIGHTLEGVAHVARIVQAMKEFAHPAGQETTNVDLNRALESVITIARNEWKDVARLETHLDPELPPVPCVAGEINQVFLNLLVNAAHAIGATGGNGLGPSGVIAVCTRRLPGQVEIQFQDNGCGIPEEIRGKIFDPFFTTKPLGKGTGQGLSIAHAVVVKKHGGTLTFQSELGKGTAFCVRLPLGGGKAVPCNFVEHGRPALSVHGSR